jgi:hypothetical protein
MTEILLTPEESRRLYVYELDRAENINKWFIIIGFVIWVLGSIAR